MKEALKTIASAWSVAFITMFMIFLISPRTHDSAVFTVIALPFAITGAGWLFYRFSMKEEKERARPTTLDAEKEFESEMKKLLMWTLAVAVVGIGFWLIGLSPSL